MTEPRTDAMTATDVERVKAWTDCLLVVKELQRALEQQRPADDKPPPKAARRVG